MRNAKYQLLQLIIDGKIEDRRGMGRKKMSWLRNIRHLSGIDGVGDLIHGNEQAKDGKCDRKHLLMDRHRKKKKKIFCCDIYAHTPMYTNIHTHTHIYTLCYLSLSLSFS